MQSLRAVNTARTIHELSSLASMYIPLSVPPQLPQYVHLDRASQWHTSALLSMAVESMTIPSRLRPDQSKRGLLADMESILNVNGNQRVTSLQCSILNPTRSDGNGAALAGSGHDQRVPGSNTRNTPGEDDLQEANASFDVDLSGGETMTSNYGRANEHIFARVESLRDKGQHEIEVNNEDGDAGRKRRRLAGVPTIQRSVRHSHYCGEFWGEMEISDLQMFPCTFLRVNVQLTALVERYRSSLQYPLLDSFPSIISQPPDHANTMATLTALSTTSRASHRIRALQTVASRMVSLDQREALCNGLGELAEAYEEGWENGLDDELDD